MKDTASQITPILLPALERGDSIGLIGPSGPWQEEAFRRGVQVLSELGFQVTFPRNLLQEQGYLAGNDKHRYTTLAEIWRNPEVKAVMAVRGGYGSLRILSDINFELIKKYPKILIGFSDITALLTAVFKQTGLPTFHGPMITTLNTSDRDSVQNLFNTLSNCDPLPIQPSGLEILKPGSARGTLLGGNLTTLSHLVSTPFEMSWQNAVLFIEDIGEAPYRVDRMLTHLKLAGRFDSLNGLILGTFIDCGNQEEIWNRVLELFQDENFPIWANFPVGHGRRNITMPIGIEAKMDSSTGTLSFTKPFLS
jgi:muramoyltetrapeptide carboxypeptidase